MEQQKGTLKTWKDDKGFGFIRPDDEGNDLFVHIRDFGQISRKPRVGDTLYYQPMKDREGRLRAADVQIAGVNRNTATTQKRSDNPRKAPQRKSGHKKSGLLSSATTFIVVAALGLIGFNSYQNISPTSLTAAEAVTDSDTILQQAFNNRQSDLQVRGSGVVTRILPDDLKGSRHQKFLIRTATGQSILVAHNIDLAPRIPNLKTGDRIEFNGEYEWNDKGGVIHWTHHDPAGRHEGGWLSHNGRRYE